MGSDGACTTLSQPRHDSAGRTWGRHREGRARSPCAAGAPAACAGTPSSALRAMPTARRGFKVSNASSNWSIVRAISSEERPDCIHRRRANWALSLSTSSALATKPALLAANAVS